MFSVEEEAITLRAESPYLSKKIEGDSARRVRSNRRKREFSKQSWCYLLGFIWYKQGAVAPKRTWGPPIFIFKFKFL